ncbi:MAG TPA: protein phosphatase 2C domain-containing protein [Vicinamibacterales bacterium]|nr:protein phosphatase 2C domain-containing protein [Vicinamibacterales bacterium]
MRPRSSRTKTTAVSTDGRPLAAAPPFRPFSSLVRIDVDARSHAGLVRTNNEDQFFVTKATRSLETMLTSLPAGDVPERADEVNYLMVVADGMGGHAAGEIASRLAISTMVTLALQVPDWIFTVDEENAPEMKRRARRVVQQVGSILIERGRQDAALRGMGSTLTGARSCGRDLLIVHVGDSRAYLFRAGRLHRLTKDHTYAQMLADTGRLPPGDVTASRLRHILTNALGGSAATVDVDVDLLRLNDGDRLLLCSDGLTDCVDDDTITTTFNGTQTSAQACDRLLQLALDGGGHDNITVIVAAFGFPTPEASR